MTVDDDFAESTREQLFDLFGQDETYTFTDGSTATVRVVPSNRSSDDQAESDGTGIRRETDVKVSAADVSDPKTDERVTLDGETWSVVHQRARSGGVIVLRVQRYERTERSREGYRRIRT